jgi:hypothetical protein
MLYQLSYSRIRETVSAATGAGSQGVRPGHEGAAIAGRVQPGGR